MKHVWQHPEDSLAGKRMFRSLGELEQSPSFVNRLEREFPQGAAELNREGDEDSLSRRSFMRFMGASTALAGIGLASCRRPVGKILPYSDSVEWMVPGKAVYYATAMPRLGGATPVIAKVHEGRPIHLQGNPLHPGSVGSADQFAIASILDFYDPERSRSYRKGRGESKTIGADEFWSFFSEKKKEWTSSKGNGLAFLHGASTSPTRARVADLLYQEFSEVGFYEYEAVDNKSLKNATASLFGKGNHVRYQIDKAHRILSIGSDFMGVDRVSDSAASDFSVGRKVDHIEGEEKPGPMNRLYAVEHQYTVTGGMADHRLPVKASEQGALVNEVAKQIAELTGDEKLKSLVEDGKVSEAIKGWIKEAVKDLYENKGKSLVLAGNRQEEGVHALCLAINNALGNIGSDKAIEIVSGSLPASGTIGELAQAINDGKISTLVISAESDPAYSAPSDLEFDKLISKVETVIHLGVRNLCATARASDWHVPGAHFLESWGDVRASDGTYSVIQPMIAPLFDGVSETAFLLKLLSDKEPAVGTDPVQDAVKETFKAIAGSDSEPLWSTTLRNGFLRDSQYPSAIAEINYESAKGIIGNNVTDSDGYEIVFTTDNKIWDGRHINNGWLQEVPDPITSLTWDNAALVGISTIKKLAKAKGIEWKNKDLVIEDKAHLIKVELDGREPHYFPVLPAYGHAKDSISISMGYGQEGAGSIAGTPQSVGEDTGKTAGFNVYPLRGADSSLFATGAKVELVTDEVELREGYNTKTYPIAITQEHFLMEGRALYRDGTKNEFDEESVKSKEAHAEHPEEEHSSSFQSRGMDSHIPPEQSVYRGQDVKKLIDEGVQQWGMSIDLNLCNGCNACTIACQSENNIPIVGKDQVSIGREMHWVRMDRYFAPNTDNHGNFNEEEEDFENVQFMPQPVACTQCEAAPCETVCPVNATVHTEEGLNAMAYNRCIGTRYCANNCPYKARRFNFFDYNKRPLDQLYKGPLSDEDKTGVAPSLKLQKNPNVTVRMRGVMEKCTYCVQRIQEAKIDQKRKARDSKDVKVPDGKIKVACQVACTADAIVFGDISDPKSRVSKVKASPRNYEMLKYLGLRARTTYLARIKNPNMKMPDANQVGTVSKKIH
ncbi:MAG: TAT-variant-translocated molybdopterin oxidoreductase [Verrucomicrobiales bacterium]|nr:TAT-variant-translocated molybdopterin oxidoreductase [Verrucomicrobiales bacterium]